MYLIRLDERHWLTPEGRFEATCNKDDALQIKSKSNAEYIKKTARTKGWPDAEVEK